MKRTFRVFCFCLLSSVYNMFVYPTNESKVFLNEILNSQAGKKNIIIPKGKYILDLKDRAYVFSGLRDVTIEGNGAEIICNKQTRAFQFESCLNVKISNLSIDYQPLCFTQGSVIHISPDKSEWIVKLHEGYPTTNLINRKLQLFDQETLQLKKNYSTYYTADFVIAPIGNSDERMFRIIKNREFNEAEVKIGDFVVLDVVADGKSVSHAVYLNQCKNMVLDNITVYGSNSFTFFETACENSTYLSCTITRKDYDPKVEYPRLRSGNLDGIHSKHAVIGPKILNCRLEYMGDDCIAINGDFYPVYKVDEKNGFVYFLQRADETLIQSNDSIVIVGNKGTPKGITRSLSLRNVMPKTSEIEHCIKEFKTGFRDSNKFIYGVRMKVFPWITGIKTGDLIYSKQRTGNSFLIEGNKVGNNRARGILVKASNGAIMNNIVEGCELAGIVIAPEFYWMEGGLSTDIVISDNVIRNCLFGVSNYGTHQPGALSVIALNANGEISEKGVFRNIAITGNKIENCPSPAVVLTSIEDLFYKDNTIKSDSNIIRNHGKKYGILSSDNVWTHDINVIK